MKFLSYDDFCHPVLLACPHNGELVRSWLADHQIPFTYRMVDHFDQHFILYSMTEETHAMQFTLRWK